ncbi:MAG: hypothetical protein HYX54_06525 [Chloroflexi bacterium]|nr:hypothetical protein [Chloroflexota bacterium]
MSPRAETRGAGARPDDPETAVRMARLHLRTGALLLARAEFEALAARGDLTGAASVDLAEARWRTGDLEGAAEAAATYLAGGGELPIARLILAEAEAAAGRRDGTEDHRAELAALSPDALAGLFAGMPHRAHWPSLTASTLASEGADQEPSIAGLADTTASPPAIERRARGRSTRRQAPATFPSGNDLLTEARDDMRSGEPDRMAAAFDRLALALRMDPAIAPRVVDLVTRRQEPAALLVRGDAFRILGRVLEAEAAYAAAAAELERQLHRRI